MSTDKIQTALFAKADEALRADAKKAVQLNLRTTSDAPVKIAISGFEGGRIKKQDGSFLALDQYKVLGLQGAVFHASISEVLKAVEAALFNSLQGAYREKAVSDFMAKVDQLTNDVAELQDRLNS